MPNGARLATGYLELTVSTRGAEQQIKDSITGTATRSGKTAGGLLGGGLLGGVRGIAAPAAGIIAGVFGAKALKATIGGGFDRALNIQNATQKLKGLGNSGQQITEIMTNALASVKGTAFGLDSAATVAAAAVASGIQPGQQLTGVLKTIADTATIAGLSMDQTGAIFNSVAARGKLQGDDLLQLQSQGVPVLQFLAKHYGITAQAASDMVSKGTVDFQNFAAAMQENLGGAALAGGETAQGAFANVRAALSRFVAQFATPLVASAPAFFNALSSKIDDVAGHLAPLAAKFDDFVQNHMKQLTDAINNFNVDSFLTKVKTLTGGLPDFTPFTLVLEAFKQALPQILPSIEQLAAAFAPLIPSLTQIIVQLLPPLANLLIALLPIITPIINQGLIPLATFLGQVVTAISNLIAGLTGAKTPTEVFGSGLLSVNQGPITVLGTGLGILVGAIQGFITWMNQAADTVGSFPGKTIGAIGSFVSSVSSGFGSAAGAVGAAIGSAVASIGSFVGQVASVPGRVAGAIGDVIGQFGRLPGGLGAAIGSAVGVAAGVGGRILGAVGNLGGLLYSAGQDVINGLVRGIGSAIGAAGAAAARAAAAVVSSAKSALGINSPSKVFRQIGVFTGQGLALGLGDTESTVQAAADRLVPNISPAHAQVYTPNGLVGDGQGVTNITVNQVQKSPLATAREVARVQNSLAV